VVRISQFFRHGASNITHHIRCSDPFKVSPTAPGAMMFGGIANADQDERNRALANASAQRSE
jgi:hypothetical protein